MYNNNKGGPMKKWSFKKHFFSFLIFFIMFNILSKALFINNTAFNIDLVQGVNNTRAVCTTIKTTSHFLLNLLSIILFSLSLLFYRYIKRLIEKNA